MEPTKFFWFASGPFMAMREDFFLMAIRKALSYWAAACNITFEQTKDHAQAFIFFMQGPLYPQPAELGYVARSVPDGPASVVLFPSERWVIAKKQPDFGEWDAVRIIAHEVGHVLLGSAHLPDGSMMAESYHMMARTPQEPDIREAIKKFGPPQNFAA